MISLNILGFSLILSYLVQIKTENKDQVILACENIVKNWKYLYV